MSKFDIKQTRGYKIAEETEKILKEYPHLHLTTARAEASRRVKAAE
jgi:hypothetical protein